MSESVRETERRRGRGPRLSDKKVRNGQRWMDFQHYIMKTYLLFSIHAPHALTHCSLHTLSSPWRYLSHPLLLSHKALRTEPCRCSPSHRRLDHILTFQQTSLIIILGVIELRSSLNGVYLRNQISTIKTKLSLMRYNWVFILQTCSLMLLASLCARYYFSPGRIDVQKIFIHLQRSESCLMFYRGYTARSMMQNRADICLWKLSTG